MHWLGAVGWRVSRGACSYRFALAAGVGKARLRPVSRVPQVARAQRSVDRLVAMRR